MARTCECGGMAVNEADRYECIRCGAVDPHRFVRLTRHRPGFGDVPDTGVLLRVHDVVRVEQALYVDEADVVTVERDGCRVTVDGEDNPWWVVESYDAVCAAVMKRGR